MGGLVVGCVSAWHTALHMLGWLHVQKGGGVAEGGVVAAG